MKLKSSTVLVSALFLASMLGIKFIEPVKAELGGTIYIRADGSIDPPTANITSIDNVTYTFTGNINDSIVVERSDIIIDGVGYTVEGGGTGWGFNLTGISNVTIKNTNINDFYAGVFLVSTSYNVLYGNNITNNYHGIFFESSHNNTFSGNNVTNNTWGVCLSSSPNNVLRSNSIANNDYNFWVGGGNLSDFVNDVDASNTVDDKPIYYWVSKRDMTVPSDAGCVVLANCTGITVQNLNPLSNGEGLILIYTTNSTITKNNITNNDWGVWLGNSSNNTVYGNHVTNNNFAGIAIYRSTNNSIYGNNVTADNEGIYLWNSSDNIISRNDITNNDYGIRVDSSSNNTIYHNNFIENTRQVISYTSGDANVWDDGYPSGGNYWSNYNGTDSDHDGIGNTSYVIDANNIDHYPLMGMFYDFRVTVEYEEVYHVQVISNSTISDLYVAWWLSSPTKYLQPGQKFIWFHVAGEEYTTGFCRITIPRAVLNGTYVIVVDGEEVPANELAVSNSTHAYLYFTYQHPAYEVIIVPEFPSVLILPLLIILSLSAVALKKTAFAKRKNNQGSIT